MKKIIRAACFFICSLPKSFFFNVKTLPLREAIKFPVIIGWNTKIVAAKRGVITFPNGCRPGMVRIGWGGSQSVPTDHKGQVNLYGGHLIIEGRLCMAAGSTLDCCGEMRIGKNFSTNKNAFISCSKEVIIGDDVMLGWNVQIYDASGHTVYHNGIAKQSQAPIKVGNHVWLASHSTLLKGAEVGDGSIVAWRSLVTKSLPQNNVLIAGNPAVVKCDKMSWGQYNIEAERRSLVL